jgi:hydrogenase maturation factor
MRDLFQTSLANALHDMMAGSQLDVEIEAAQIEMLPEAKVVCEHFGIDPLGMFAPGVLVIAGEAGACETALLKLRSAKIPAKIIGQVLKAGEGRWLVEGVERVKLPYFHEDEVLKVLRQVEKSEPQIPA